MNFAGSLFRTYINLFFLLIFIVGCAPPSPPVPDPGTTSPAVLISLSLQDRPLRKVSEDGSILNIEDENLSRVNINDVIIADRKGRGLLRIQNRVRVNIFQDSELRVTDVQEADNRITLGLEQNKGHSRVQVSENANASVNLKTSNGDVATLVDGTDFIICHNPEKITCIVVIVGEVEVTGQGKRVILKGGQATYMNINEPPSDPICTQSDQVQLWIDEKISANDAAPISTLVTTWDTQGCGPQTPETPTQSAQTTPQPPSPAEMVRIPAGVYTVGVPSPDPNHVQQKRETVEEFWIDKYEVTNEQYANFVASGNPPPTGVEWPGVPKKPVAGVTWDDAQAYCAWANKRLPSEIEWEVAARGEGEPPRLYPWGDDSQAGGLVYDVPLDDTYEVGSFSFNQSPFHVFDMAGNVWEWVDEPYEAPGEGLKVLRGGRYGNNVDMAHRELTEPDNQRFVAVAGFRCAADQVEGQ